MSFFFNRIRKIHMMGMAGTGMRGMAEILLAHGFLVSGCDTGGEEIIKHLESLGAKGYTNHDPSHVQDVDVVVYSSALPSDHPELLAAQERGIPTIKRAVMLGEITRLGFTIAFAGTHGKTTSTALAGFLAEKLGWDPTILVGGRLWHTPSHAREGKGSLFIVEADEYDHSFLHLHPVIAVTTTIDADHLDYFQNLDAIQEAFLDFYHRLPFFGTCILNLDDPLQKELQKKVNRKIISYGTDPLADFKLLNWTPQPEGSRFTVRCKASKQVYSFFTPLLGLHNIYNTIGVLVGLWEAQGKEDPHFWEKIREQLPRFPGVGLRFEVLRKEKNRVWIADYAHHPKEIQAVYEGLKQFKPTWEYWVVFQPHLFSRTFHFYKEFSQALFSFQRIWLLPIYPAREKPMAGVSSQMIVRALKARGHHQTMALEMEALPAVLKVSQQLDAPPHVLSFLGAGDIHRKLRQLLSGGQL